ncbi:MAG: cyclic nucleotide-binding domain-containing protein [Elusimicrobia bacterium]|nr:cyclic nucleotide-binding domain-containing protein [Elusimicrobiota bacterium]
MPKTPVPQNIRPKDLDWLAQSLKLSEALSESPALESLLESLPAISLEVWPAYQDVLREGERGEDFFVVYKGELSVWRKAAKAAAREVGRLGPGDFFGEIGFLMKSARSATVRTESACRLFRFPARDLTGLLKKHKALDAWIKQVACTRVQTMFQT